jgi:nicotinamidase-related amidase
MDYQAGIVSIYAKDQEDLLARASSVLKGARDSGMTIVHVQVGFRPGLPEVSPRNLLLGAIKSSEQHQRLFQGAASAIHEAVAPEGDDIVVTKHRVNAFTGTDLEMILRAKEVDTLALFGIATGGVVLSTLLHAADADYRLIVIKDCCADLDAEVHSCLVNKLFPRQATVVSARDFLDALSISSGVNGDEG